ncbi:MAG: hypothetical protein CM15mP31_4910 [Gammaproteobacteria bacterium]|nr:MAG: hypothetical protein CM15mP31_4910 [Gammaproteobacteria bacterium]
MNFSIMLVSAGEKKFKFNKRSKSSNFLGLKKGKKIWLKVPPKKGKAGVPKKKLKKFKGCCEAAGAKVELK